MQSKPPLVLNIRSRSPDGSATDCSAGIRLRRHIVIPGPKAHGRLASCQPGDSVASRNSAVRHWNHYSRPPHTGQL